jgi:hypothetical protein
VTAPLLDSATPEDLAFGVEPESGVVLELSDDCGIVLDEISLEINDVAVDPVVEGDPTAPTVSWDGADFMLDQVVKVDVHAVDEAGNELDATVRFRIWDDFSYFTGTFRGIDSAQPNTVLAAAQWYTVSSAGADKRVVTLPDLPFEPEGTLFLEATYRICSNVKPPFDTTVTCHALTTDFTDAQVTWNSRKSGNAWATAGASHVPNDREAEAAVTILLADDLAPYQDALGDIKDQLQQWMDGDDADYGMVCSGDDNGVTILSKASNCPPMLRGRLARPVP